MTAAAVVGTDGDGCGEAVPAVAAGGVATATPLRFPLLPAVPAALSRREDEDRLFFFVAEPAGEAGVPARVDDVRLLLPPPWSDLLLDPLSIAPFFLLSTPSYTSRAALSTSRAICRFFRDRSRAAVAVAASSAAVGGGARAAAC
jgi:hypothetical protein